MTSKDRERVLACARGRYQMALLTGREPWSGAGLRGEAGRYASQYAISRANLVARIRGIFPGAASKLVLSGEGRSRRWRRELVIDGEVF